MTLFTLPTSRVVTQNWNMDFQWLNGTYYPRGFYATIGWLGHNGIDFGCYVGDPVESVCDGIVEYVGPGNNHPLLTGGGNVVLVRNDELQMRFEYLHLSQQNVYTGQRVKRSQVIALSGNTGTSTAPHLHLGAIPIKPNLNNGYRGRVDPTSWLYGPNNPDHAGVAAQGVINQPSEEDDMDFATAKKAAYEGALQALTYPFDNAIGGKTSVEGMLSVFDKQRLEIISQTAETTARLILGTKFKRQGDGQSGDTDLGSVIAWSDSNFTHAGTANVGAGSGLNQDQVNAAIKTGLDKALEGTEATIKFGAQS